MSVSSPDTRNDDATRLRRCLNDLVSLGALPAAWTGSDAQHIAASLADALIAMLRLTFVLVRIPGPDGSHSDTLRRAPEHVSLAADANPGETLTHSLGDSWQHWPAAARVDFGGEDLSVACVPLGLHGEVGLLVTAASRTPFPEQTEELLLNVAANHATIGLQHERILSRERQDAAVLEAEVERRTLDIATAREQLVREIAERRRAEDAADAGARESRALMDAIPGMVALLSPMGEIDVLNQPLLEYFGQSKDELTSWAANGTIHPDDVAHVVEAFAHAIAIGTPYEIVQRFRRADGVYRWFQNKGFPLRNRTGAIVRWCVLLTDIDDRTRAEEELRQRERESRLIVDSIPGLIVTLTSTGVVEAENLRTKEYLGPELSNTTEWAQNGIVCPDDIPRVFPLFVAGIESGAPFEYEVRLRHHDGVYRWFQLRAQPLHGAAGDIVRWFVLLTDIDARKGAEDALRLSERALQLTLNTVPALVWSALPDGTVDFLNQHYLDFVGLSSAETSGWDWTAAVHPQDRAALTTAWRRLMAAGTPGEVEARMRRRDGEYRWFLFRMNPLCDQSGRVSKWYGVNTDIEDRKRAEDVLGASERNLREMTETIPEMLWSAMPDGAIDYCNTRFLEYTGFSADDVRNDGWQRTIHPEDAARVGPIWMSCVATGAPYRVEVRTLHAPDGTYRLCAVNALPLRDEQGRIVKWHGTIVDMHDWKATQDELRAAQAALAHATRVTTMGELTASIAHEINQPLSGIVTNANAALLMLGLDPPDIEGARETARRTLRDGQRASDVMERLRALFRKTEAASEIVDLNDAIREVVELSSSELFRKGVALHIDLADSLPAVVGDRVQLQQVVLNLVLNAADAMSQVESRQRHLRIATANEHNAHVRVTVSDTGVGIAPDAMPKLFDAFFTTKSAGMGMGLSVSRSIVSRHYGRLWAARNDGPGATFAFSIPLRPPA